MGFLLITHPCCSYLRCLVALKVRVMRPSAVLAACSHTVTQAKTNSQSRNIKHQQRKQFYTLKKVLMVECKL